MGASFHWTKSAIMTRRSSAGKLRPGPQLRPVQKKGGSIDQRVVQIYAMDESRFWPALEYRVCREMAGVEECASLSMWCDGFVPYLEDIEVHTNRIEGRVWIGFGRRQESWTFELLLSDPIARREQIRWADLLPAEDVTRWLSVDHGRKHLVVAPGDAAPDAA